MTVWDSPVLAIFAALAIIFICCSVFVIVRNIYRDPSPLFETVGVLAAIAAFIFVVGAVLAGGVTQHPKTRTESLLFLST